MATTFRDPFTLVEKINARLSAGCTDFQAIGELAGDLGGKAEAEVMRLIHAGDVFGAGLVLSMALGQPLVAPDASPPTKETKMRHTAESLTFEFMGRANEHNWVRLSRKQGAWLYSLICQVDREQPTRLRGIRHVTVLCGGKEHQLREEHNGSWILSLTGY